MTQLTDQVAALTTQIETLNTTLAGVTVPAAEAVDLSPLVTAIATLQQTTDALVAKLQPTT